MIPSLIEQIIKIMSDYDVIGSEDRHLGGHTFVSAHNTSNHGPVTLIYDEETIIKLDEKQSRTLAHFMSQRFPCRRKRAAMSWWQRFKLDWQACMDIWRGDAKS
jgi:hypothetical protein